MLNMKACGLRVAIQAPNAGAGHAAAPAAAAKHRVTAATDASVDRSPT
ncbi:hypothetical protein LAUMK191_01320 [Mycobacterium attenuatum]|uniref:Uncharacterized protein n=1 Tax=Mycobacterium attenuatum TaxID=2341086 RepID=A0A498PVE5_9MYCO|nr:hypothetical protein LAUMK136_01323 [Mycobacterium attenuatum]VBA48849.1 hypothetical protein LAUMK191_01320 [Mycobacterium attenuatum]VBA54264.1 hypothetical protein LAUMK41_01409 [Mycobacterium attenuatum]